MPDILAQYLGVLIRGVLFMALGGLVKSGWVEAGLNEQFIGWLTSAILVLVWALWTRYRNHQLVLSALQLGPGASITDAKTLRADPAIPTPSVLTPNDQPVPTATVVR